MVEIYSPSMEEGKLSALLASEMEGTGFRVRTDAVGNVIGEHGTGEPRILLCGHMDTVPPMLPVRLEGGRLYGRGAVDAKGPLAAMIVAASQLVAEGCGGSLVVVGAVDEEGRNTGVRNLIEEGVEADYAVFGEPTDVDTITVGYRGGLLLRVTCETETGHSSAPWLYDNAIEEAMAVWGLIKSIRMSPESSDSRFNSTSSCLMRIEGGGESSVVPGRCEALVETRIPPPITVDQLHGEISRLIEGRRRERPGVKINVEVLDQSEPYVADKRSPLVRALSRSIWRSRGVTVKLVNKTGTGDMNLYGHATGRPVVTYGPGDPHLDHTPHESISVRDYLDSISVLKGALGSLIESHNPEKPRDTAS
jgi:LysW-gamma-L-lysine carboxypeptidase